MRAITNTIDHRNVCCPGKWSTDQPESDLRATDFPDICNVGYCPSCKVLYVAVPCRNQGLFCRIIEHIT